MFFKNDDVAHSSCSQLKKLNKQIAVIEVNHSSEKAKCIPADEFYGLQLSLSLSIGAKVMLTLNLWTGTGLCNGPTGTIVDIISKDQAQLLPTAVIVCFDAYTGPPFLVYVTVYQSSLLQLQWPFLMVTMKDNSYH